MKELYDSNIGDYVCYADTELLTVTGVVATPEYELLLTFSNAEKRKYDARPLLEKKIYEPLKNTAYFLGAKSDGCSVYWSDEVDIAPEHLYECSISIE